VAHGVSDEAAASYAAKRVRDQQRSPIIHGQRVERVKATMHDAPAFQL
jgi:hypothetical protein